MESSNNSEPRMSGDISHLNYSGSHATTEPVEQTVLPQCPYCHGSSCEMLFNNIKDRLRYAPGSWSFYRCKNCGSALLFPRPNPSILASFYPPAYTFSFELEQLSALKRIFTSVEYHCFFRPQYEAQVRRVMSALPPEFNNPAKRCLLDIGCGRGLRLLAFRRRGFDVNGFDFQRDDVLYLQNKHLIPATCGDVVKIADYFPAESFDIITAFYILEHLEDVHSILKQCFNLLKPGGWLIGAVPLFGSIQSNIFRTKWLNVTEAPRHISLPTQEGLKTAFVRTGFEAIRIRPEPLTLCAGIAGLSLFPRAAGAAFYGGGSVSSLLWRGLAAMAALISLPICYIENSLLSSPSHGMFFATKSKTTFL